jgi:hypothetical protein
MNENEKRSVLIDIAARIPYGTVVNIQYIKENGSSDRLRLCSEGDLLLNADLLGLFIENEMSLKPYLRPLSSMTEDECKYIADKCCIQSIPLPGGTTHSSLPLIAAEWLIDFYNEKHLDFRGLIPKGLAIEVTKENNPYS